MKTRTKKILLMVSIPLCVAVGFPAFRLFYAMKYAHRHCIKLAGLAFEIYQGEHKGQYPFSTNGFGNALLLLVKEDYLTTVGPICGSGDDGHIFKKALTNNSVVPEDQCSRIYIQGLSETNDPQICILFDRNSCPGGDHFRSPWPWSRELREVCFLDGSMEVYSDENWPEFSRRQVELLIAAGFSQSNALRFYPAAR